MTQDQTAAPTFEWSCWVEEYGTDPPSVVSAAKAVRDRGSITSEQMVRMAYWKSPRAAGKVAAALRGKNRQEKVCDLPPCDQDEALITTLTKVSGVSTSMASAVLALVYPERFAVTDWRARDQLKRLCCDYDDEDTAENYLRKYLPRIREIAGSQGITPRKVDMALWAFSRERSMKKLFEDPGDQDPR